MVDTSYVMPIVEQTLHDIESGKTRASKQSWLSIGLYPLDNGKWYLVDPMRFVYEISEDVATDYLSDDCPLTLAELWNDLRWKFAKLTTWLIGLIRKPVL